MKGLDELNRMWKDGAHEDVAAEATQGTLPQVALLAVKITAEHGEKDGRELAWLIDECERDNF